MIPGRPATTKPYPQLLRMHALLAELAGSLPEAAGTATERGGVLARRTATICGDAATLQLWYDVHMIAVGQSRSAGSRSRLSGQSVGGYPVVPAWLPPQPLQLPHVHYPLFILPVYRSY